MKSFKKIALAFVFILTLCASSLFFVSCNEEKPLSLASTFKTTYYVGEELDVTGGILRYVDEDGDSSNIELKSTMVSIFSTEKPGKRKLMITYQNESILVDYTVKPWDVQDNVYYSDVENHAEPKELALFLCFNKAQNEVTMFNDYSTTIPESIQEEKKQIFPMTKSFDEDGNIVYKIDGQVSQGGQPSTPVTYTITNITKDSLKMSMPGYSLTLTIHHNLVTNF